MEYNAENIKLDAVIPWVNGNDENWQNKINQHLDVKIDFKKKRNSVRFNSIGEIDFAIKSIIKYASCFKTIYLVTDNQIPNSFEALQKLSDDNSIKLEVIDHKIIFEGFENYLPCFNSTSIITLVYRIPNLSEHFVLFNDDTFVMRKTVIQDYFKTGHPVLRGVWQKYYEDQKLRLFYKKLTGKSKQNKATIKQAMQAGAKLANDDRSLYLRRFHTPISMRKSTLQNFFNANRHILEKNIKYRFRDNSNQFITETLANHLEINANTYYYAKNTQLTYFRSYKNLFMVKLKLYWFTINKNKRFMTFQSLEMANEKTLNYILKWLTKKLE